MALSRTMIHSQVDTPLGRLLATGDDRGRLTGLWFDRDPAAGSRRDDAVLRLVRDRVAAYFAGEAAGFGDVPLALAGTPWQLAVWRAVRAVPFGTTLAYGDLAARLGRPAAARAVGAANGRNPVSVIVPCHRLVGAGGALTGYAGGLERKAWLIAHERRAAAVRR